jgi:hypothetical protein
LAVCHQSKKSALIIFPTPFLFLVSVEHFLRGREQGFMAIVRAADFSQKILKIIAFAETGKLGDIVETNVKQAADASGLQ